MVNSAIILMVLALALFFYLTKARFMVYFSIPTFFVYVFMYILISRGMYSGFLRIVYFWLTLYMGVATVCLGYSYGFHLYSMSMIPIIYYTNYMAYKLNLRKVGTGIYSGMIVIMYLLSTMHVSIYGPIYESNEFFSMIFWVVNSLIVFSFLVFYLLARQGGDVFQLRKLVQFDRDIVTEAGDIGLQPLPDPTDVGLPDCQQRDLHLLLQK